MAEQFGIQQILVERCAVERNKRAVPTPRQEVQAVGDQLFTGSALTNNQYRLIERCEPRHLFQHLQKTVGLTQQIIFVFSHDEINHSLAIFTK
ncbi:hypothetical protein D3C80_1771460 [compost metagenome]